MATVRISPETHKLLQGLAALDGASIGDWIARATETQIADLAESGDLDRMMTAARAAQDDLMTVAAAKTKAKGTATVKQRGAVKRSGTAVQSKQGN